MTRAVSTMIALLNSLALVQRKPRLLDRDGPVFGIGHPTAMPSREKQRAIGVCDENRSPVSECSERGQNLRAASRL